MNVLDARVINTTRGLETYIDLLPNIEVEQFHIPSPNKPSYEIMLGIEYFLLSKEKYYESQKHYFWIEMSNDYKTIKLKEPETQSLFAVKNESEKQATKEMIGEWLIKTEAYKQVINKILNKQKEEGIQSEEDIKRVLETIKFFKELLRLEADNIRNARLEKYNY